MSYSKNGSNNTSDYNTQYRYAGVDTLPNADMQNNRSNNGNRFWNMQSDYTSPIGKKGKLEAGVKATMRHIDNDYIASLYDWTIKDYEISPVLSNKYTYDEDIVGGYVNFANAIGNLGYQVGVRINIDVLNAQSQLYQTKRDLAVARYNVLLGSLRLRQAAGTLAQAACAEFLTSTARGI